MYAPYLGKNDHLASIEDIEVVPISQVNLGRICLNSLYVENMAEYVILSEDEEEEMDHYVEYMYREKLPLKLDEATNYYIMASFVYTDALLEIKENQDIYSTDKLKLAFY
jgi:CRISPR-associated protein Cas5h